MTPAVNLRFMVYVRFSLAILHVWVLKVEEGG